MTASGEALNGDSGPGTAYVDDFFRLYGDSTGDRVVNLADFAAFRNAFGKQAGDLKYNDAFDSNDDNLINLADFALFRSNFGRSLNP